MEKILENLCGSLKELIKLPSVNDLSGFLEGETAFLYALKNYEDKPATPSALSEDLGVTKGRITAIINSLARKEMIELKGVPGDRRKVNVRITEKGAKFIDEKITLVDAFLATFIERIGRDKAVQLTELLNFTVETMKDSRVEGLRSK